MTADELIQLETSLRAGMVLSQEKALEVVKAARDARSEADAYAVAIDVDGRIMFERLRKSCEPQTIGEQQAFDAMRWGNCSPDGRVEARRFFDRVQAEWRAYHEQDDPTPDAGQGERS